MGNVLEKKMKKVIDSNFLCQNKWHTKNSFRYCSPYSLYVAGTLIINKTKFPMLHFGTE